MKLYSVAAKEESNKLNGICRIKGNNLTEAKCAYVNFTGRKPD